MNGVGKVNTVEEMLQDKDNRGSIEQKQLVNGSIQKIEITALNKSQRLYKLFYDNC